MPWCPSVPGEVPTLGWYVIDWMTEFLAAPARAEYEPFVPYKEQEDFLLRWYEIDPRTGRFKYNRGLLGRSRGWGKSPVLAGIAAAEALADVLPDGWDADGQPVGRPWSTIRTPLVHVAAVSLEQTKNTWQPLLEMIRDGPVMDAYPGLDPLDTFIVLPKGKIEQVTSSSKTVKGAPTIFSTLDQTEEWVPSVGGPKLAQTLRTNTAKNGGRTLESPNAFIPGQGSVAEDSAAYAAAIIEGRSRAEGLLYDHREWPANTDMSDRESLTVGLRVAYGDSSAHPDGCVIHDPPCPPGHVELEPLIETIWDPASDVQQCRSDFGNQITHASDAWVSSPEWADRMVLSKRVDPRDTVVVGFDGSRGRVKGKADATALIGCRVSDGHLFEIRVWEQPTGPLPLDVEGKPIPWEPKVIEVDAEVRRAFDTWNVVGFYADPSGWNTSIAAWEAAYGSRLKLKASREAPMSAWPRGKDSRVQEYVVRFHNAVVGDELTHDGSSALTRHVLNARRRETRTGYLLYKAYPDSPDKIDAAYAAVMAWKARLDAVSQGIKERTGSGRRVIVMN
jgi:hypothetical protein